MSESDADETLTVTGERCPMNYVRTKLRLEAMSEGRTLEVFVSSGEAARNVPRSAKEDGHEVLGVDAVDDERVRILIRKRETPDGT